MATTSSRNTRENRREPRARLDPCFQEIIVIAVVLIDDEPVFEVQPDIPSEPELWDVQHVLSRDFDPGSPVVFHLHNHGTNSWRLGVIEAVLDD